jgi:uncharacterized FlaG/YvyC family protein
MQIPSGPSPLGASVPGGAAEANRAPLAAEVRGAVRELNHAQAFGEKNELTFVIDRVTRRPLLRVVNRETKEVVMQVPPEHAVEMAREQRERLHNSR